MERRTLRRVVAALAAGAAVFVGAGWLTAKKLTARAHPRFDEPAPTGFDSLELRSADGITLGAWWAAPEETPRAAVVLVHGNGASRTELSDEAQAYRRLGCAVLPVTVRAHGDSGGEFNDMGLSAGIDVAAAVIEARRRAPGLPVIVHGMSLGSAAALFAVADRGAEVEALVLVGPYGDLRDAVRRRTDRYLWPGFSHLAYLSLRVGGLIALPELASIRPAAAAARIGGDTPALVIAGGADDRAPLSDAQAVAEGLGGAQLVVAPGIGHDELGDVLHNEAWGAVEAFVDEIAPR